MTGIRAAARAVAALVLALMARLSSMRAGAVVVYHRVGGRLPGDPHREILPTVPDDAFARQLRHLRRRYRVVAARDILEAVRARRRLQRFPVAITFDDDLESHIHDALPALQRARLTATFFLTGSSLHGPHAYWWEDLQRAIDDGLVEHDDLPDVPADDVADALERVPKAIFRVSSVIQGLDAPRRTEVALTLRSAVGPPVEHGLRPDDVRALAAAGCDVAFHTLRHEPLPTLSDPDLERALREGRDELKGAGADDVDLIAYPHGKGDARVAEAARSAGFTLGFTTGRELVRAESDPLLLPRLVPPLSATKFALRLARAFRART